MLPELEQLNTAELSQALAPEDLRVGDFVCVLRTAYQILHQPESGAGWQKPEVLTLYILPPECDAPRKIMAISLPFVFVRNFEGKHEMLDLRRLKLARVSASFARKARKRLRSDKLAPQTGTSTT